MKRSLCICGGKSKLVKYRDDLLAVCYRVTCQTCGKTIHMDGIDPDEVKKRINNRWNLEVKTLSKQEATDADED